MADIKLTLSADPAKRSPNIEAEARWLKSKGAIYYQLQSKPLNASAGCWVYFIRDGQVVARAKAKDFRFMKAKELGGNYTGFPQNRAGWRVKCVPPMEIAARPIPHKGFQGFRYVSDEERVHFEGAFIRREYKFRGNRQVDRGIVSGDASAYDVIHRLMPGSPTSSLALKFLARSIKLAHKTAPDRWGLTLNPKFIRLNVGKIEVLAIKIDTIRVLLDMNTIPRPVWKLNGGIVSLRANNHDPKLLNGPRDVKSGFYVSVNVAVACDFVIEECREVLPLVEQSHLSLIGKSAQTPINGMTRRAHSHSLIAFLSDLLKHELPQPGYCNHLGEATSKAELLAEEIAEPRKYHEGAVKKFAINAYERDPLARKDSIRHYGATCFICGFNFEQRYGAEGKGLIHVHHLRPLSEVKAEYELDPIRDLRPVWPNCHAMIHRRVPPYSIIEMKEMLR